MPETKINLFAVFDGHSGDEASELASKNLHRRFLHHLYARVVPSFVVTSLPNQSPKLPTAETDFSTHDRSCEVKLVEENQSSTLQKSDTARKMLTPNTNETMELFEHSALGNMLKEALSKAISDIESTFLSVSCAETQNTSRWCLEFLFTKSGSKSVITSIFLFLFQVI